MKKNNSESHGKESGPLDGLSKRINDLNSQIPEMANFIIGRKPILITGGSGIGKRRLAEAIGERAEKKSHRPFFTFDLSEYNPNLIESELFGHEKGAFTGAVKDHMGILDEFKDGILFLDEIGNIDKEIQRKLLSALDGKPLRKVGGGKDEFKMTSHLIFATNKNAEDENNLDRDFYYRIATWHVEIPDLGARGIDIVPLINEIINEEGFSANHEKLKWNQKTWYLLLEYDWADGGYRELRREILSLWRTGKLSDFFIRHYQSYLRSKAQNEKEEAELTGMWQAQARERLGWQKVSEEDKKDWKNYQNSDKENAPDLPVFYPHELSVPDVIKFKGQNIFFSADRLFKYILKEIEFWEKNRSRWPDPRENFDHVAFLINLIHFQKNYALKNYIPYVSDEDKFKTKAAQKQNEPYSTLENEETAQIESLLQKFGYRILCEKMRGVVRDMKERKGYTWPEIKKRYDISRSRIITKHPARD